VTRAFIYCSLIRRLDSLAIVAHTRQLPSRLRQTVGNEAYRPGGDGEIGDACMAWCFALSPLVCKTV
jgi:hypothetical protein